MLANNTQIAIESEEINEEEKETKETENNKKNDLKKLKICAKETALIRFMRFLLKRCFLLSLNTKALIGIV